TRPDGSGEPSYAAWPALREKSRAGATNRAVGCHYPGEPRQEWRVTNGPCAAPFGRPEVTPARRRSHRPRTHGRVPARRLRPAAGRGRLHGAGRARRGAGGGGGPPDLGPPPGRGGRLPGRLLSPRRPRRVGPARGVAARLAVRGRLPHRHER